MRNIIISRNTTLVVYFSTAQALGYIGFPCPWRGVEVSDWQLLSILKCNLPLPYSMDALFMDGPILDTVDARLSA